MVEYEAGSSVHLDPNQRYQITNCLERFGIPIRNLDVELIFQGHDRLDHIEAGGTEIRVETCSF